jgi:hemerythrin-like metal-binding protein
MVNPYLVHWHTCCETGHEKIDSQHRQLVVIFNRFLASFEAPVRESEIRNSFASLVIYFDLHFATEEKLMREVEYPRYKEHLLVHQQLASEIARMLGLFKSDTVYISELFELFHMMARWSKGILGEPEDRLLAEYLLEQADRSA